MILVLIAALLASGAVWTGFGASRGYTAKVVLPAATNLVEGGKVLIDGFSAGQIAEVAAVNGKAHVTLEIGEGFAPLHSGAEAVIVWKAVLGERQVDIRDGAESNPPIPDGGTLKGEMSHPVEMDEVFNALDRKTRAHLRSMIGRLQKTIGGKEQKLQETLQTSGPALKALGEVLRAVGSDGRAIKRLVRQTNEMVGTLAERDDFVRGIVQRLSGMVSKAVDQRKALESALGKAPEVLAAADRTLGKVPETTHEVIPLLKDLRPAAERLPSVAQKLQPVLQDLRPTVAALRPTLRAVDTLLQFTPELLDGLKDVLPAGGTAIRDMTPALRFLRPYTPEVVGWLSNWASSAANYDSKGHYMRIFVPGSGSSFNHNPGVMPPGLVHDPYPLPGELVGQPWRGAYGSEPK